MVAGKLRIERQATRRLRALPHLEGGMTPAVAVSGYARIEDRERALNAGFQMLLAKPVDDTQLIAAITRLSGAASRRESAD